MVALKYGSEGKYMPWQGLLSRSQNLPRRRDMSYLHSDNSR